VRKYTRTAGTETIVFADDNINGDRGYSIELFKALAPLGIRWSAQCSVNIGRDEELLDLAQESGCQSLLMGFESISQESLESINKGSLNKVEEFEEIIDRIHARKINIYFMVVLGLDGDDETVFEKTSEFLTQTSVAYPAFNILTPVPGTRLYSRLEDEGRLLHKRWGEYAGSVACFRPRNMSIETLQQGFYWIMKEQYSLDAVLERIGKLWNQGVIRLERRYLFARLVVTILLALQWLCNRGEMAELVKKTIQLLWQKKWINIDVLLINLTCFEFAKTLPAPNLDFCSGASGRREGM
jgi:radical SAM superfamily enzyme YgiQ (UPF0313 family)